MNPEDQHNAIGPDYTSSADAKPTSADARPTQGTSELKTTELEGENPLSSPQAENTDSDVVCEQDAAGRFEESQLLASPQVASHGSAKAVAQQSQQDESQLGSAEDQLQSDGKVPSIGSESTPVSRATGFFEEQPSQIIEAGPHILRRWTRRDVLSFGAGAVAAIIGGGSLLPQTTLERLGVIHHGKTLAGKEWLLNKALRIDDDVAEALYSKTRLVPIYTKSQITPLKNNYNGATPDPGYIPEWHLTLSGLASGLNTSLNIRSLLTRFQIHEQITRLVCVEGWSAIAWWAGLRFDDLLHAYPPMSQAKLVRLESSVNLDPWGNPDPYFVSLDLSVASHPQTLLVTHFSGRPLTVDHGAPLRLIVPVKLGLKNVKAITKITYTAEEPKDYWAERGYSRYDGL